MSPLRARVEKGRLVLDEPTTLPDGTVIDLVVDDEGDDPLASRDVQRVGQCVPGGRLTDVGHRLQLFGRGVASQLTKDDPGRICSHCVVQHQLAHPVPACGVPRVTESST